MESSNSIKDFFYKMIDHYLDLRGKQIFAEKTPSNSYCFPQLSEIFPEAKFIHIYRDGRDVVCSRKKKGETWFQSSSLWLYNTISALQLEGDRNYYALSYENLVCNTEKEIRKLCEFLSIEFSKNMITNASHKRTISQSDNSQWSQSPLEPINPKSIGRYKTELTTVGRAIFYGTSLTKYSRKKLNTSITSTRNLLEYLGYSDLENLPQIGIPYKSLFYMVIDRLYRGIQTLKRLDKPQRSHTKIKC